MLLGLQTYFICAVNYPSWTYLKHLYLFCVGITLDWWTGELNILKVSHSGFSCHSYLVFNFVHASIVNQVGSSLPKTRMKCQQNSLTKAEVYLASISSFCRIKGLCPIYPVSYLSYLSYIYPIYPIYPGISKYQIPLEKHALFTTVLSRNNCIDFHDLIFFLVFVLIL